MHNRMPSRPRQGNTIPELGSATDKQDKAPRQPHERDESADSQARQEPSNKRIGEIAHADLAEGQVDTDKGPVLDATYDKVREGTPQPDKKFRP